MPQVTGVVEKITSKQLSSGTYYSFVMDDAEWYRTNKDKPPFVEGSTVTFTFDDGRYGKQVDLPSIVVAEGAPKETPKAKKSFSGGGGKDQYWTDREARDLDTQKRISYQAAANTAIALVGLGLNTGVISLPKSKKESEKLALLKGIVEDQTKELFKSYQLVPDNYDELMGNPIEEVQVVDTMPQEEETSEW